MTDAALIAAHLNGDAAALPALMRRHEGPLLGFLRARVGDDAEELHQELWIRVVRGLDRYVDTGRFRAFLFTSARRLVIDHHRRRQVRPQVVQLDEARAARAQRSPDQDLSHQQLLDAVERAITQLDPQTAQVLRWRLQENLPFKEIARRQDAKLNTVLSRAHRGLKALRVALEEHNTPLGARHG